jgi:hypothetical protein
VCIALTYFGLSRDSVDNVSFQQSRALTYFRTARCAARCAAILMNDVFMHVALGQQKINYHIYIYIYIIYYVTLKRGPIRPKSEGFI